MWPNIKMAVAEKVFSIYGPGMQMACWTTLTGFAVGRNALRFLATSAKWNFRRHQKILNNLIKDLTSCGIRD
jgi:hypothetical protein